METRADTRAQKNVLLVHSKESTNLSIIDVDATEEEYEQMSKREVTVKHNQIQDDWIGKQTIFLLRGFSARKYSDDEYNRVLESFISVVEDYITTHPDSSLKEIYWNLSRENDSKQLLLSWNGNVLTIGM